MICIFFMFNEKHFIQYFCVKTFVITQDTFQLTNIFMLLQKRRLHFMVNLSTCRIYIPLGPEGKKSTYCAISFSYDFCFNPFFYTVKLIFIFKFNIRSGLGLKKIKFEKTTNASSYGLLSVTVSNFRNIFTVYNLNLKVFSLK